MDVLENALVDDSTIADDILDKRVNKQLSDHSRRHLRSIRHYRLDQGVCSDAIYTLASELLPVIFEDNQVASYEDTIKRNPWLVKLLIDAYNKQTYGNIQRVGLLRQLDRLSPALNLPADFSCLARAGPDRRKMASVRQEDCTTSQEGKEGECPERHPRQTFLTITLHVQRLSNLGTINSLETSQRRCMTFYATM